MSGGGVSVVSGFMDVAENEQADEQVTSRQARDDPVNETSALFVKNGSLFEMDKDYQTERGGGPGEQADNAHRDKLDLMFG